MTTFLLPSDPLSPARPDEHFAWRHAAARAHGAVALVDLDALPVDGRRALRGVATRSDVVYLGWMLAPDAYDALAAAVAALGGALRTDPAQYRRAHHLPGWYDAFAGLTPASVWFPVGTDDDAVVARARSLGSVSFVVKDYVKSRKHEWATACFAAEPEAVPGVIRELVRLAEGDVAGGIVVRAFEQLVGAEARVWWVDGEPAVVTSHPDTPDELPEVELSDALRAAVRALGCPFVTTDLVRDTSGATRVVEVGDGQVSDFPRTGDLDALLATLARAAGDEPVQTGAPSR